MFVLFHWKEQEEKQLEEEVKEETAEDLYRHGLGFQWMTSLSGAILHCAALGINGGSGKDSDIAETMSLKNDITSSSIEPIHF